MQQEARVALFGALSILLEQVLQVFEAVRLKFRRCAKTLHLVAQVLPKPKINYEPCSLTGQSTSSNSGKTSTHFYKLPYVGLFSKIAQTKLHVRQLLKHYCKADLDVKVIP